MDAPPPRKGSKLVANLKRLLLLVVLLVGVLGGAQLWQISFARKTFEVSVDVEADVTGGGNLSGVRTEELLSLGELVLTIPAREEPLLTLDLSQATTGEFQTVGRGERDQVEQGRVRAVLRLRGADPDRPTLDFPLTTVEDDHIALELRHDVADEFLARTVHALVAVRNQHDTPVTGLSDRLGDLEEQDEPGVYHVRSKLDDVLWNVLDGVESASLQATDGETNFGIRFPFSWFLAVGDAPHVVQVEEEIVFERPRLVATRVSPRSVSPEGGWSGSLQVGGENLDLADDVYLVRGDRRVRCRVEERSRGSLRLSVDPGQLSLGRWNLEFDDGGDDVTVLAAALTLQPGFVLREPEDGRSFAYDADIPLRWRVPGGVDQVLLEASAGGAGAWQTLYRGDASAGGTVVSALDLDAGEYRIRLTAPGWGDLPTRTRRIIVDEPPTYGVTFRFTRGGRSFANVLELAVDGERIDIGPDPALIQARLSPGTYQVRAEGGLGLKLSKMIEVTEDGQFIDLEFQE